MPDANGNYTVYCPNNLKITVAAHELRYIVPAAAGDLEAARAEIAELKAINADLFMQMEKEAERANEAEARYQRVCAGLAAEISDLKARNKQTHALVVEETQCPDCNGTGANPMSDSVDWLPCHRCGGIGKLH